VTTGLLVDGDGSMLDTEDVQLLQEVAYVADRFADLVENLEPATATPAPAPTPEGVATLAGRTPRRKTGQAESTVDGGA
jgi:hypothetical protein